MTAKGIDDTDHHPIKLLEFPLAGQVIRVIMVSKYSTQIRDSL